MVRNLCRNYTEIYSKLIYVGLTQVHPKYQYIIMLTLVGEVFGAERWNGIADCLKTFMRCDSIQPQSWISMVINAIPINPQIRQSIFIMRLTTHA